MFRFLKVKSKYSDISDESLVDKASNNKEAVKELYGRYVDKIYKYAFYKTSDKEAAEDITSETFLNVFENINNFNKDSTFKTYLFSICRYKLMDYYRESYSKTNNQELLENTKDDNSNILDEIDKVIEDEREKVRGLISGLDEREQKILIQRYVNNRKLKDIADDLGLTLSNVKVIKHRALKKLKEQYDNREER